MLLSLLGQSMIGDEEMRRRSKSNRVFARGYSMRTRDRV